VGRHLPQIVIDTHNSGHFYVMGGSSSFFARNDLWQFDFNANHWWPLNNGTFTLQNTPGSPLKFSPNYNSLFHFTSQNVYQWDLSSLNPKWNVLKLNSSSSSLPNNAESLYTIVLNSITDDFYRFGGQYDETSRVYDDYDGSLIRSTTVTKRTGTILLNYQLES
jgi:hypothetical protein